MSGPSVAPFIAMPSYGAPPSNGACSITSAPVPHIQFKPSPAQSFMIYSHPSRMDPSFLLHHSVTRYSIPRYNAYCYPNPQPVMSHSSYLRSSRPSNPLPIRPHGPSLSSSPATSFSGSTYVNGSPPEQTNNFGMDPNRDSMSVSPGYVYGQEYMDAHHGSWPASEHAASSPLDSLIAGSYQVSPPLAPADDPSALLDRYLKQEEPAYSSFQDTPPEPFSIASESSFGSYHQQTDYPVNGPGSFHSSDGGHNALYGYSQPDASNYLCATANSPSFTLVSSSHLQYPQSPENIPRYVQMAQVSPNMLPTVSLPSTDDSTTSPPNCDPRYTIGTRPDDSLVSQRSQESDGYYDYANGTGQPQVLEVPQANRKRSRTVSFTSSASSEGYQQSGGSGSGESEKEDSEDEDGMDGDEEYVQRGAPRARHRTISSASASSSSRTESQPRRIAAPVPVPNLTKKSRGRHVPTASVVVSEDGVQKNTRSYRCVVPGCDKCFARGEHLKRHVRSIHTNEKPHKCPACGKDFSRHDNLGQHMRVHKNWNAKQRRIA